MLCVVCAVCCVLCVVCCVLCVARCMLCVMCCDTTKHFIYSASSDIQKSEQAQ